MSTVRGSTPRDDGFVMPAEWEEHDGTWLAWPERPDNWRLGARPAQDAYTAVATALSTHELVTVGVSDEQYPHCRTKLPPAVRVVELSTNDSWIRDMGPTFVVNRATGARRGVDWIFNAWGGLEGGPYFPWDKDERVARKVLEIEAADRYVSPFVLEGGSIDVDGDGTCLVTEECLLNANRNPDRTRGEIERNLRDHLGVDRVVWLGAGVFQDETDGHVDNLARFVAPGRVALTWTDDVDDPQYEISLDARTRLEAATDAKGRSIEVQLIPAPGPLYRTAEEASGVDSVEGTLPRREGDRLAASYVNFYIGNQVVLVPMLDPRRDDEALEIVGKLFPDREAVGIDAREILLGGGNIHCITQQVPVRPPAP